jgi:hypothetical protein
LSSSDSNTRHDPWARHYREAAERRHARGWRRRGESSLERRQRHPRNLVYVAATATFVALTIVALLLPR